MSRAKAVMAAMSVAVALALVGAGSAGAIVEPRAKVDRDWPANVDGTGCEPPVWPQAPHSADDSRVLVIGDSLIRETRTDLEAELTRAGYLPTVRCWGAMGTDWGVDQVHRARELGQLPRRVVVSLGTNDIWWLSIPMDVAIDQMMAALGPKRKVYWVNLWFGPIGYAMYDRLPHPKRANEILRAKAREYPNLRIVNFAGAFRAAEAAGKSVGWTDGVHMNAAGYRVRNAAILAALARP